MTDGNICIGVAVIGAGMAGRSYAHAYEKPPAPSVNDACAILSRPAELGFMDNAQNPTTNGLRNLLVEEAFVTVAQTGATTEV